MKIDELSEHLELGSYEVFKRIKYFEFTVYNFLQESESDQYYEDLTLNSDDIKSITTICKNCCNNVNLCNQDCLLEIILLYYYIMDIFHDDHNSDNLENYFQINNFTDLLVPNISSLSKPYFIANLNRKM